MKAIVLAAGQGTRLRPYTDNRPKCLVELAGKSLLERQLAVIRQCGIDDITIVAGYRADLIEALGLPVVINEAYDRTNMVSSLFCARPQLTDGTDVLITYGDLVFQPNVLQALIDTANPVAITIDRQWHRYWQLRMDDPLSDAETLKLDGDGNVTELGRKPGSLADIQGQYMGLTKVAADSVGQFCAAYDDLDTQGTYEGRDHANMYMTTFIQSLIDRDWRVRAAPVDNGWLEVDTAGDLELYEELEKQGKLAEYCQLS